MPARKKPITFAIVDIKSDRHAFAKTVCGHKKKIPITLTGYLTNQWSGDDGESIEFEMTVETSTLGKPVAQKCNCLVCQAKPK